MTLRAALSGALAIAISLIAMASPALATGIWSVQNPTSAKLNAISCPVAGTCFAVGGSGTVVTTSDGGAHWTTQASGTTLNLNGISCVSATTCVAVGNKGGPGTSGAVITTTNGGTTWAAQVSGTSNNLDSVRCLDASTCLAVGVNGTVVRTVNGGTNWAAQVSGTTTELTSVSCPSALTCFAVGGKTGPSSTATILATADGGTTWSAQTPGTISMLNRVSCTSTTACTAVGVSGTILATTNGGAAWSAQTSGTTNALKGIACPSAGTCFATGAGGTVLATTNGGTSWTAQASGRTTPINAVSCTGGTCVAVGDGGAIISTSDGGATWTPDTTGTTSALNGIACTDTATCVAVGQAGTIVGTTNGGARWSTQASGVTSELKAVSCPSASTCYAVGAVSGSFAVTIKTTDGGATWAPIASLTNKILYGAACTSTTACWAVGASGVIVATSDGGATGSLQASGTTNDLAAISCPSATTCVAAGGKSGPGAIGTIALTTNAGASWSLPTSNAAKMLNGVSCGDATHCVAVGDNGTVVASANAGATWTAKTSGTNANLEAVDCVDAVACWAVGAAGAIFKTADGGTTWSAQTSTTTSLLHAVSMPSTAYGYAVGATGTIDAYVDDTTPPAAPNLDTTPGAAGSGRAPAWAFTAEEGSATACRLTRGATVVADWASCTSPGAYDLTGQPDGTYTFSVRATDQAGNTGTAATDDYTLDTTAPAAPTVTAAPATPGTGRSPAWSFTAEAGATTECRLTSGATVVSGWASCASPRTYDLSLQGDGTYTFSVRATDAVGNVGAAATSNYVLDTTAPAGPSITAAPATPASGRTPAWSFTGEIGATLQCRLDRGATTIAGWASCSAGKSYDLTGQPDGTYTFSVRATDAAGNTGTATTGDYVLDTTAPAAPAVTSAPATPGSGRSPSWSFTAEPGAAIECRLDRGATTVSGWSSCSSPRGYDLTGQPEGTYTISVRATDAAGNTGSVTTSSYVLDTVAPAVPSVTSAPATPDSGRSPSWSFTAEPGAAIECRLDRGATTVSAWASCAAPRSYDLSLQPDGTYTFSVRATDAAGNVGSAATSTYVLDSVAPAAPAVTVAPGSPDNDRSPSWSFTAEAGATTACRLDRGATVISGWGPCSAPAAYDLAGQADGTYTFSVRATDAAGNTGAVTTSDYALDATAPAAPALTASPSSPASGRSPSWSFTAEVGANVTCRLDRGATVVSDWAPCASPRSYDLSLQPEGTYTFSVRATDAAGNTGATTTGTYVLDTLAPAAPALTTTPASPASGRSPAWMFTGEVGASFECRLDRGATSVAGWAACAGGKSYDLTGQPDGTYTFSVRATDAASNTGAAATGDYVLDTTAPTAPSVTSSPTSPGNARNASWSFTGEAGASFECRLDRGATTVAGWASCTGTRAYDLSAQPDGTYTFSVRATDAAGNTGSATTSDYAFDTTAPAAPAITVSPGASGSSVNPSWSFTGEAGATFACRVDRGATTVSGWTSCTSPSAYDLSLDPDGTYTFSVRATDASGNTGIATTSDYALVTTRPAAPALVSPPASPGRDTAPSVAFTGDPGTTFECRVLRGAATVSGWAACASPHVFDLSGQPDDTYTLGVRAENGVGTLGPETTLDYTLDTAAPAAPALGATPGPLGRSRNPSWSFSGEAGASFACRLDRGATSVSGWSSCTSPRSYDLTGQPDGGYTFSVRATDPAGNTGTVTTNAYALDATAPAAPTLSATPGAVAANVTPAWSFSGEAGAAFECRLDRGATTVSDWTPCSSPRGYALAGQPDGDYVFSVRAIDPAGNTGATQPSAYRLLTAAPGAPAIAVAPPPTGNGASPSWSFSGDTSASFECRVDRDGAAVADWTSCTSPFDYPLLGQPDGAYVFSVRARNEAGTTGLLATSGYLLDTVAPGPPAFVTQPDAVGRTRKPAWTFQVDAGSVAECRLAGPPPAVASWSPCLSPASFDLKGRPDGDYTLEMRSTDAAGNVSRSTAGAYSLDTNPPDAPKIDADPGSDGTDRTPAWSFSGEKGATFQCRLAGVDDWAPCTSPKHYDLSGQPAGSYAFSVRATDPAGNVGTAETFTYALRSTSVSPAGPASAAPSAPEDKTSDPGPSSSPAKASNAGGKTAAPHASKPAAPRSSAPTRAVGHRTWEPPHRRHAAPQPAPRPAAHHHKRHGASAALAGAAAAVTKTVAHAAKVVVKNADKTAFPGVLLFIVLGFVGIQNRIDRNDPKLAIATNFADEELEFGPPPRRRPGDADVAVSAL